jgi:hypothetical protein
MLSCILVMIFIVVIIITIIIIIINKNYIYIFYISYNTLYICNVWEYNDTIQILSYLCGFWREFLSHMKHVGFKQIHKSSNGKLSKSKRFVLSWTVELRRPFPHFVGQNMCIYLYIRRLCVLICVHVFEYLGAQGVPIALHVC